MPEWLIGAVSKTVVVRKGYRGFESHSLRQVYQSTQVSKTCVDFEERGNQMEVISTLQPGCYYHLYNRGNNRENIFFEERNCDYFLRLYLKHVQPVADTYAYCLLPNHFHFLVRIRVEDEISPTNQNKPFRPSQGFSNLFNAYAKAVNKAYKRTGSIFEDRFHRHLIDTDSYFLNLVFYIHFNPQKHNYVKDFRVWKWSSYKLLETRQASFLNENEVIGWFGNINNFRKFHQERLEEKSLINLFKEDE